MSSNNESMDDAKSKIEKIRFDLEQKLAALEAAKIKNKKKFTDSQITENSEAKKNVKNVKEEKEEEKVEKREDVKKENIEVKNVKEEKEKEEENVEKVEKKENVKKENIEVKNEEEEKEKEEENVEKVEKKENVKKENIEVKNEEEEEEEEEENVEKVEKKENVKKENIEVKNVNVNVKEEEEEEKGKVISLISENITDNKKQDLIKEIVKLEDDFDHKDDNLIERKLDIVKNVNIVKTKLKDIETEDNDATFFEINDVIEKVDKKKATNNIVSEVIPTIVKKKKKKKKKEKRDHEVKEKKAQNSKLNYLMYALGGLIFLSIIFLSWNYLNKNSLKKNDKDKTLSEYENRRYKDSIELADANNQLLDFQSQRYIDSIANANQITLESDNSKDKDKEEKSKSKKTVKPSLKKLNKKPVKALQTVTNNNLDNFVNSKNDLTNALVEKEEPKIIDEPEKLEPKKLEPVKKPKIETLTTIEKSPIYPGCEKKGSEVFKKKCLMSKITKFISNKFNTRLTQDLDLDKGRKRINVSFIIDRNGNVNVLKIRGQHKVLEKEALRVVSLLPKMKPGRKNGKSEPILYTLPIVYEVE
ncbi:MAG: energy transducer TonB [Flavobacteriaceae bacterium]|nr:energy transducer TonB [Flavobacteriaceae bacterium]